MASPSCAATGSTPPMELSVFTAAHYTDLLRSAEHLVRREATPYSPQEVVHESYLRLARNPQRTVFNDAAHGWRLYRRTMKHTLVDHARKRRSLRRGGGWVQVEHDLNLT